MNTDDYTRVTTILYPFSGLDRIDEEIVRSAGIRGTKVHKICELIIQGFGEIDVDEETFGYIESFKKWWSLGHEIESVEQRFWDDELQITGQLDLIIKTSCGLSVVDFKTSYKHSKTWEIQGCAYAYLAKKCGYDIQNIQFIHLNKTGKQPKIFQYTVNDNLFFSVYTTWKHFYK